jgi:hypothetical protein
VVKAMMSSIQPMVGQWYGVGVKTWRKELLGEEAFDVVVDAHAPLRGDHLALALELLLGEREVRHPVGLERDRQLELRRRHAVAVVRPVDPGGGVGLAARPLPCAGRNSPAARLAVWLNMRCSKRCARPVLPGRSWLEPTRYQVWYGTTGAAGSRRSSTTEAVASWCFSMARPGAECRWTRS